MDHMYDVILSRQTPDGVTAAWAVWRTLPADYRDRLALKGGVYDSNVDADPTTIKGALAMSSEYPIVFAFVQPNSTIDTELVAGKRVLIVGIDLGAELVAVVRSAESVVLVDHHQSTHETLRLYKDELFEYRGSFSMYISSAPSESSATLMWRLSNTARIPPLVDIVRIGENTLTDLRADANATAVLKYLQVMHVFYSFRELENVFTTWETNAHIYAAEGEILMRHESAMIRRIAQSGELGYLQTTDGSIYTTVYTSTPVLAAGVRTEMKLDTRFGVPIHLGATWTYQPEKNRVVVTLAAVDGLDAETIARAIVGVGDEGVSGTSFAFAGLENFHHFILRRESFDSVKVETESGIEQTAVEPVASSEAPGSASTSSASTGSASTGLITPPSASSSNRRADSEKARARSDNRSQQYVTVQIPPRNSHHPVARAAS